MIDMNFMSNTKQDEGVSSLKHFSKAKCSARTCPAACSRGVTTLLVVGFMGIFMLILGTISSFAMQQGKYGRALYDREQASGLQA